MSALPPRAPDPTATGALQGIRVLDISRLVAGNMTTHLLADFGADVIKVERPGKGDDLRAWKVEGVSTFWKVYGRSKRSIALDIRSKEGEGVLRRLIGHAQVLVENFVPGTLEGWGLGPDELLKLSPDLVILRVSGWGQTGPYAKRPGFGTLIEALSGFAHLNGYPDKPPALPPLALGDMIAGLYGAYAVMVGLHAVRTGKARGQVIDLSLFEPLLSFLGPETVQVDVTGKASIRAGNESSHTAPRNVYACADGTYLALSGSMQSMTEKIFDTIGRPELKTDPRFASNDDRIKNRAALDAIIGGFIVERSQAENLALFEAAGVTVGPIASVADLFTHPYVLGREAIVALADPDRGATAMPNITPRLSATPGIFRSAAPSVGQHTAEILAELEALDAKVKP